MNTTVDNSPMGKIIQFAHRFLRMVVEAARTAYQMFRSNLRQGGIVVAFIVICLFFSIVKPAFLSPGNLTNLVLQYSYILILALGMMIVIIAGHIDLSVGSVVGLTGAVAAIVIVRHGFPWWVGVLAALLAGLAIGAWQGFWVAVVGIPAFIVTLAGMLIFRGLTFVLLDNRSLSPFGGEYYGVANGFLNGLLGGNGFDVFTLVIFGIGVAGYVVSQLRSRAARRAYRQHVEHLAWFVIKLVVIGTFAMAFAWKLATHRGLPIVLIILSVFVLAYGILAQRTVFGRHVYAIGGNLNAAKLSGVRVKVMNFWIMVNMGVLAAVGGILYSSRSNGAQPSAGEMFELDAIAACFVGGAAVSGGVGRIAGAIVGGLTMAVMSNGMQLMGISTSTQNLFKGMVLLLAVGFDVYSKRRGSAGA